MTLSLLLPYGHHGLFIAGAFGVGAALLALELVLLARRCRATREEAGQ